MNLLDRRKRSVSPQHSHFMLLNIYTYTSNRKPRSVPQVILATHLLNQSRWFIISRSLFDHPSAAFGSCWGPLCNNGPLWGCKINVLLLLLRTPLLLPQRWGPPSRHVTIWRHVHQWSVTSSPPPATSTAFSTPWHQPLPSSFCNSSL